MEMLLWKPAKSIVAFIVCWKVKKCSCENEALVYSFRFYRYRMFEGVFFPSRTADRPE